MIYRLGILTFFVAFLASCGKERVTETFFPSGQTEARKEFLGDDTSRFYITYFREDGSMVCEGEKNNGQKQGRWAYYNSDNIIQSIENFCNGFLCDTQKYFFPNGKIQMIRVLEQPVSCFCDTPCVYSYNLVAYWGNGNLREKSYLRNCEFHGRAYLYDSLTGKQTYEISYNDGVKEGPYKEFYEDGSVREGRYKNGDPAGRWFTALGDSLISEKMYDDR